MRSRVFVTNLVCREKLKKAFKRHKSKKYWVQKCQAYVFPSDESAVKLLYMALMNISKKWTMPTKNWKDAMNSFAIMFGDRV
jgi:transposase-like protein